MLDEATLRAFLKARFHGYQDTIRREEDLGGIVDSLGLFELVEFVEQQAGITVPTADFTLALFSSIERILQLAEELRAQRGIEAR